MAGLWSLCVLIVASTVVLAAPGVCEAQRVVRSVARHPGAPRPRGRATRVLRGPVGMEGLRWGSDTTRVNRALARAGFQREDNTVVLHHSSVVSDGSTTIVERFQERYAGLPAAFEFDFEGERLARVTVVLQRRAADGGTAHATYSTVLRSLLATFGAPSVVVSDGGRQAMWAGAHSGSAVTLMELNAANDNGGRDPVVMISLEPRR